MGGGQLRPGADHPYPRLSREVGQLARGDLRAFQVSARQARLDERREQLRRADRVTLGGAEGPLQQRGRDLRPAVGDPQVRQRAQRRRMLLAPG